VSALTRTIFMVALTLGCFTLSEQAVPDEAATLRENKLKAGYLFNFAKFVEWPQTANADVLAVCFIESPGVQDAFAASVNSKRIRGRSLLARSLALSESADGCEVVYVGSTASSPNDAGWPAAALTVSDSPLFTSRGGIIELFSRDNRLRFKINVGNAHRAGLKISSGLLQLASAVEQESAR
jgi:hypothetical protein